MNMDYINSNKLVKYKNDFGRVQPSNYNPDGNLTKLQWEKIEEDKKHRIQDQMAILRSYNGHFFKDSLLIKEITPDTILAVAIISNGNDSHYEYPLSFKYSESFKEKLLKFGKGGNGVNFVGKIINIESFPVSLELISIEKGCFVATACYENYDAPEVLVLRQYRDDKLLKTFLGRIFVSFYYSVSPFFATLISKSDPLKKSVLKYLLEPIVTYLKRQNTN